MNRNLKRNLKQKSLPNEFTANIRVLRKAG